MGFLARNRIMRISFTYLSGPPHHANAFTRHYHKILQGKLPLCCRPMFHTSNDVKKTPQIEQRRSLSKQVYFNYMSPDVFPISMAIGVLDSFHSSVGLPWWLSIAITTVTVRSCVTLPLQIYSLRHQAKLDKLSLILEEKAKELAEEVQTAKKMKKYQHWDEKEIRRQFKINMNRITQEERLKNNVHPAKAAVVSVVQIPLWISMSLALRNMSGSLIVAGTNVPVMYPDLATEGTLWFPNLLLPDVTLVIPVISMISNLMIIEMFNLKMVQPPRIQRIMTYGLRFLTICVVPPVAASLPTCVTFYWMFSSLYGLSQNIVLRLPKVRRKLGIPKSRSESETPFQDMWYIAKKKYDLRNKFKNRE